jgi:hypothetical protein
MEEERVDAYHPNSLSGFPSLPKDSFISSIASIPETGDRQFRPHLENEEKIELRTNTVLIVLDNVGYLHAILDGTFPFGKVASHQISLNAYLIKSPGRHQYLARVYINESNRQDRALIKPVLIAMPMLENPISWKIATHTSLLKELCAYTCSVLRSMHNAWFGLENRESPRLIGLKWLENFSKLQDKDQNG